MLAWRRECGTGRLSLVPCKTNEAIEKVLPTSYSKVCKCSNLLLPLIDIKLSLHMTLAETLRQRCLLSVYVMLEETHSRPMRCMQLLFELSSAM